MKLIIKGLKEEQSSYLIAPFVNNWHVDVIHKDGHLLACWWPISRTHALVDIALDGSLLPKIFLNICVRQFN